MLSVLRAAHDTEAATAMQARGVHTVAVTCTAQNALAASCATSVHLPLERELCPFNLAPVTSTAIQLIWGDTLAVALMNARGVTRDEYARNHPAGRIGKRLTLTVRSVMRTGAAIPAVVDQPVVGALPTLTDKGCGCLVIVDKADPDLVQGVFTDGDLRRAIQQHGGDGLQRPLSAFMTEEFKFTTPSTMAVEALQVCVPSQMSDSCHKRKRSAGIKCPVATLRCQTELLLNACSSHRPCVWIAHPGWSLDAFAVHCTCLPPIGTEALAIAVRF